MTSMLLLQDTLTVSPSTDAGSMQMLFSILVEGGWLMIPITLLSFVAIYVIAERWRSLNAMKVDEKRFLSMVEDLLSEDEKVQAFISAIQ